MNNETKHTPEPWAHEYSHKMADGNDVFEMHRVFTTAYEKKNIILHCKATDAARIVECVNALAGLTSEEVEQVAVWVKEKSSTPMFDLVAKNRIMEAQRNELLEALQIVRNVCEIDNKNRIFGDNPNHWTHKVIAAINKATGQ
jgi:hypothetical protein